MASRGEETNMTSTRLIGSAKSLTDLCDLLKRKWYWSNVQFVPQSDIVWAVKLYNGEIIPEMRVVKRGNRYRLEGQQ